MEFKLTFDVLPVVGVVMVFLGYYLPGFKTWFGGLTQEWKQGFMLLMLLAVDAAAVGLSVAGIVNVYPVELKPAIMAGIVDFVIAVAVNAGVYKSTDRINDKLSGFSVGKYG